MKTRIITRQEIVTSKTPIRFWEECFKDFASLMFRLFIVSWEKHIHVALNRESLDIVINYE